MVQDFGNAFLKKPAHKAGTATSKIPRLPTGAKGPVHPPAERKLTFAKIIRWRLPDGQTVEPAAVEVAGTFTNWQKVPLVHDAVRGGWHVTLPHIPGNRTHHYMLLAKLSRKEILFVRPPTNEARITSFRLMGSGT